MLITYTHISEQIINFNYNNFKVLFVIFFSKSLKARLFYLSIVLSTLSIYQYTYIYIDLCIENFILMCIQISLISVVLPKKLHKTT